MGSLAQAKTLGGVGSILVLLSLIPFAGPVLSIAGFVLTLIAIKYVSESVGDRSIFKNMLIAVILSIAGVVIGFSLVFASVVSFIGLDFLRSGFTPPAPSTFQPGDYLKLATAIALGLAALWIFFLVSAVFLRRSYNSIAARVNVEMFRTAALLYLIGAALTIVIVGFVLIFVAQILQVVAFFSIQEQAPPPSSTPTITPPAVPASYSNAKSKSRNAPSPDLRTAQPN